MNVKQKIQFRNQLLIVISRTAGLIMIGVLGIYYFSKDIERSAVETVQKRTQIALQNQQIDNLSRLKSGYEKVKDYLPFLKNALPGREELIVLPARFEDEARQVGATQSFSFGAEMPAAAGEPPGILFSLNITADGDKFIDYLQRLEALPYFLNFIQFELTSEKGLNNPFLLMIKGKIYTR